MTMRIEQAQASASSTCGLTRRLNGRGLVVVDACLAMPFVSPSHAVSREPLRPPELSHRLTLHRSETMRRRRKPCDQNKCHRWVSASCHPRVTRRSDS